MNQSLNIVVYFYPLIVILISIMSLNITKNQSPVASKKWIYLSWLNIVICYIIFAILGLGLDSFLSFVPMEQAKELRNHKAIYFVALLVLSFLQKFKSIYPMKVDTK